MLSRKPNLLRVPKPAQRSARLAQLVCWQGMAASLALIVFGFGCRPAGVPEKPQTEATTASETEPEEEPITAADVPLPADYVEAVQRLGGYRDAIRNAVLEGKLHSAHKPLDETNIALERLPTIARSSKVPRRDWEAIVEAGDDLGEALGEIHEAIDAGQSPDYTLHAKTIDDALARLAAIGNHAGDPRDGSREENEP